MGKPKKGAKSAEVEEESDVESQHRDSNDDEPKVTKKIEKTSKKSKSKNKSESDQGELSPDEDTSSKKAKPAKAKKESKKKKKGGSDSDDGIPAQTVSAFNLLNIEDSDDGDGDEVIDNTSAKKSKQKKNKDTKKKDAETDEPTTTGKKGKKKKKDDEDWDAILAEYQDEGTSNKPVESEKSEEPKKKDSKKKGKSEPPTEEISVESQGTEATASKKKDKKKKKGDDTAVPATVESKDPQPNDSKIKPTDETTAATTTTTEEGSAAGKKKKGPGKAMVAAMQEALKKKKEEEERLQREEEERIRLIEEAERIREEKERIEKEKKDLKKQKEKERKERAKAEGRLLTAKQKADKARAESLLKSLREQGVDVPGIGEKRDARPSARSKRSTKPKKDSDETTTEIETKPVQEQQVEAPPEPMQVDEQKEDSPIIAEEPKEEIKDSWDVSSGEDENDQDSSDKKKNEKAPEGKISQSKQAVEESSSEESESSASESSEESDSSDETESIEVEKKRDVEKDPPEVRIRKREEEAEKKRTISNLRAAVVCVLGHVDTGKTKILDKLRRTNVQDGEAGGITQQIGATNVPIDAIKENTRHVREAPDVEFKIPGLLIIDTPGHESFSNLRTRGSSLCDIAILVVDIMHGLEPQTLESINLLKARKTPFVVALNKIDRLYDWQTTQRKDIRDIIKSQAQNTQNEFEKRTKEVILQFNEQGLNAALFYENTDTRTYVSLVPTSAITGEGMGNLLMLICQFCQNQLAKRLTYSEMLQATVLEVKAIQGLGTTIDAILVNGKLREGETMIVAGTDGPIVTQIRALLLPHPMKELRVKNNYIEQKEVMGAQGIKIAAKDLEKAMAGINLQIAREPDEIEYFKEVINRELKSVLRSIKLSDQGVFVQASTLGSLEALLEFLKASKIPYAGIRIGPVVKRDVMKASIMLEHQSEYATILAFDVKIERDAQELADNLGVKIFQADIIYHLFDKFTAYREDLKQQKRDQFKSIAVFPCKLKILPQFIFNSRDPIVMGVMVEAGIVKEGTPLCVVRKKDDKIEVEMLGVVASIENNHKNVPTARKGLEVCIKIENVGGDAPKMYGRHFDEHDFLLSKISRESIDACKDYFRDELVKTDWALMIELKNLFGIL